MKIKYLGTAASEGTPALFCSCEICKNARSIGGKEIRTRCQAIIDDGLLIDFGPDTYLHLLRDSIDITLFEHCLITHAHSDHLYVDDIGTRCRGLANLPPDASPLKLYGGSGVEKAVVRYGGGKVTEDGSVLFRRLHAFEPAAVGEYTVIPIPAIHSTGEPFVYAISRSGKTILYAHDTGILPDGTLGKLQALGAFFDLVSMDCNEGIRHIDYRGHMNVERDLIFMEKLRDFGLAGEKTVFVANHFSHNGRMTHEQAEVLGKKHGFIAAYDGMEMEI